MESTYFRKGFGLKGAIEGKLTTDYHSGVVELLRASGNRLELGPLTIRLAQEFGFCYGVDRAVEYAYETRTKFPDKRLFLVGEIIHNPHVNANLERMGIAFLRHGSDGAFDFSPVTPDDVVIMPAFGVTITDFERLRRLGCVMVDTTCGSVLNVWKRVESYARDGFTAIIHGKSYHEETKATASQVEKHAAGKYLVVFDMAEARLVCDAIEGRGDPVALSQHFAGKHSPGFDFSRDLERIGVANQTTMLSSESLAIADEFRKSCEQRYGAGSLSQHFRTFDTICSATQERQDAIIKLLEEPLDVMVIVGGYNSSNTTHLAALVEARGVRGYHIEDSECIDPAAHRITYQPVRSRQQVQDTGWLESVKSLGITAGASTPNNKIGETVVRICETAGLGGELEKLLRKA